MRHHLDDPSTDRITWASSSTRRYPSSSSSSSSSSTTPPPLSSLLHASSSSSDTMGGASSRLSIPASHFLAQPRVSLPAVDPITPPSARPDTTTLASADYDVDVRSGFLPPTEPLSRLPQGPWSVWEEAWDATDGLRAGYTAELDQHSKLWRRRIVNMAVVVDVSALSVRIELLRRAHAVLAFLTHTWAHTSEKSNPIVIPASLAIPLCEVSRLLDVPPILTYADTVLYNWQLKDPAMGFVAENILTPLTFTRTESEVHFYKSSFLIETLGPACLSLMRSSLDEAFVADQLSVRRITDHLVALAVLIMKIKDFLEATRTGCDPKTFYWEIRPWFNGGSWIMQGVEPLKGDVVSSEEGWRISDFGGPSAGQSTLIHALDVFLGVDHRPRPSEGVSATKGGEETFMMRMSAYMPHHHRRFLTYLSSSLSPTSINQRFPFINGSTHSVRSLAMQSPPKSPTRLAYDSVVAALGELRKQHSKIALLYIISQSRIEPPTGSAFMEEWKCKMEEDRQKSVARQQQVVVVGEEHVHKGTGGTDLAKFLKRCRDRTAEAILGDQNHFSA